MQLLVIWEIDDLKHFSYQWKKWSIFWDLALESLGISRITTPSHYSLSDKQ